MNYKILFSVLAILFVFLLASGTAFAAPVEIRTTDDFMKINDSAVNRSLDYILMNDIDFKGKTFTPIGENYSTSFNGTFNGNGYTISNITFSNDKMDHVGLFGYSKDAEFNNVTLKNVNVSGKNYVGGLLGNGNNVSITGCSIESGNSIISGSTYVGGLVGGISSNSSVINSYAIGDVNGSSNVGSLIGDMTYSSVSNSYATGNVTGSSNSVGGFVGRLSHSSISDSYATGNEIGNSNVGGFVGYSSGSSVFNSSATGNVTGNSTSSIVGGFIGNMSSDSFVYNSYATGNAIGNTIGNSTSCIVGGFVGSIYSNSSVYNSYATGNATGNVTRSGDNVSGFVGYLDDKNAETINIVADSFYVGTPNSNNLSKGLFVTSAELKQISTFTTVGSYLSASWDISSSPNSSAIWYINERNSYPLFNWNGTVSTKNTTENTTKNTTENTSAVDTNTNTNMITYLQNMVNSISFWRR